MGKVAPVVLSFLVGVAVTLWLEPLVAPGPAKAESGQEATSMVFDQPNTRADCLYENRVSNRENVGGGNNQDSAQSAQQVATLLDAFTQQPFDLESAELQDLSYWVRRDKAAAILVQNALISSESYEARLALLEVLSQDNSETTLRFAIELTKEADPQVQALGLQLLASLGRHQSIPELNQALLEATYYETDPDRLTDIIVQLGKVQLDDSTKDETVDRFLDLLSSDNELVKARAIDGLAQLSDSSTIQATLTAFLYDVDENVKVAAISALLHVEQGELDPDIKSLLREFKNSASEPSSVHRIASSVLDFHE